MCSCVRVPGAGADAWRRVGQSNEREVLETRERREKKSTVSAATTAAQGEETERERARTVHTLGTDTHIQCMLGARDLSSLVFRSRGLFLSLALSLSLSLPLEFSPFSSTSLPLNPLSSSDPLFLLSLH